MGRTLKTASNRELAAHYRVSVSTIKSWQRKGYDVRSPKRLQAALDAQRSATEITPGTPLAKARLAKLEAETIRIRHQHEVEKGEWTRNDEVTRIASAWGAQVRAELMALIPYLPTLAGMDAAALEDRGKLFAHGALSRLQNFAA